MFCFFCLAAIYIVFNFFFVKVASKICEITVEILPKLQLYTCKSPDNLLLITQSKPVFFLSHESLSSADRHKEILKRRSALELQELQTGDDVLLKRQSSNNMILAFFKVQEGEVRRPVGVSKSAPEDFGKGP